MTLKGNVKENVTQPLIDMSQTSSTQAKMQSPNVYGRVLRVKGWCQYP